MLPARFGVVEPIWSDEQLVVLLASSYFERENLSKSLPRVEKKTTPCAATTSSLFVRVTRRSHPAVPAAQARAPPPTAWKIPRAARPGSRRPLHR